MKQSYIFILTICSFLLLGILMYWFSTDKNNSLQQKGIEMNELKPRKISRELQEEVNILKDNSRELIGLISTFFDVLEHDHDDFSNMSKDFREAQNLIKDLERMDLDSVDIAIHRDKYIRLLQNIVGKANVLKEKPELSSSQLDKNKIQMLENKIQDLLNRENSIVSVSTTDFQDNTAQIAGLSYEINNLKKQLAAKEKQNTSLLAKIRHYENMPSTSTGKPQASSSVVKGLLAPFIEVYDGGNIIRDGKRVEYHPNKCLESRIRRRKGLKTYLVIPKVASPSKTKERIFGSSENTIVAVRIYADNKLLENKEVTLSTTKETHFEITNLIAKSRKSKTCKTYRLEIHKAGGNHTENKGFNFLW